MGDGVPRDDAEAARWFRKAADQGNRGAQAQLALSSGGKGALLAFLVKRKVLSSVGAASIVAILLGILVVGVPHRRWGRATWLPLALVSACSAAVVVRGLLRHGLSAISLSATGRVLWITVFAGISALYAIAAVVEAVRTSKLIEQSAKSPSPLGKPPANHA